jgi:hypothetical protein
VDSPVFPPLYFVLQYVLRLGFLDGGAGARFALLKAGYFAEVGAKIAEQRLASHAARPPVATGIGAPR